MIFYDFPGGYVCVTSASCVGLAIGLLLLHLRIRKYKWTPKPQQSTDSKRRLLSPRHISDGFFAIFRKRDTKQRFYIVLLCLIMITVNAPFSGEGALSYLYVRTRYGWEVDETSRYGSFDATINVIGETFMEGAI